jgi:predicted ribosome quality control (RQC) complex YloA/Tae2 family protein
MKISNLELKQLVDELEPFIADSRVKKIQELPNDWLKAKLNTKKGTKDLIIAETIFYLTNYSLQAKQQSSGFSAFLKKRIGNHRILKMEQHELDRVVYFEFEDYFLVLELFAKGNIVLCDKEWKIIKARRKEEWKDRKLEAGFPYKFPASGISPLKANAEEILPLQGKDFFRSIIMKVNAAPEILEKAFENTKRDKQKKPEEIKQAELEKVLEELKILYSEKPKTPVNEMIDNLLSKDLGKPAEHVPKIEKLTKQIEEKKKVLSGLKEDEQNAKEKAEAIYENYSDVQKILEAFNEQKKKGKTKKEVMYTLSSLVLNNISVLEIDLEKNKILLEINKIN